MRISDWSSDVCSSDLEVERPGSAQMGRLLQRLGGNPAGRQGQGNPERRRHRDREGAGTQRGEAAAAVAPGPALRSYQVIETHRFSIAALPTRVSRTRRLNRRYIAGLLRPGALSHELGTEPHEVVLGMNGALSAHYSMQK